MEEDDLFLDAMWGSMRDSQAMLARQIAALTAEFRRFGAVTGADEYLIREESEFDD